MKDVFSSLLILALLVNCVALADGEGEQAEECEVTDSLPSVDKQEGELSPSAIGRLMVSDQQTANGLAMLAAYWNQVGEADERE